MSIQITWQDKAVGQPIQQTVALLEAELVLTLVGCVIIDASWKIPSTDQMRSDQLPIVEQVREYLLNPSRNQLEIQLLKHGSVYSQKVWQALLEIPCGQVVSYSALACKIASGPRAVAQACKNNPYAGIVPCHRVVAKSGIGGFMGQSTGQMVQLKQQLLAYERSITETVG